MNTIVSFTVLAATMLVIFTVTYPDPPVVLAVSIPLAVAAVFPVLFYPISKSLWSAIDLAMRGPDPDDDVDPRFIPPRRR